MKKAIYSFIYYRLLGWKTNVTVPNYDKCVICAAPHTTNLDLFIGKLFYGAIGRKTSFMMKKEWFFFPLGIFFKAVGGIPVDRSRKTSLVDQMVHKFAEYKKFNLAITPEGTRKANPNWKKGFYFIALKAQVPIVWWLRQRWNDISRKNNHLIIKMNMNNVGFAQLHTFFLLTEWAE